MKHLYLLRHAKSSWADPVVDDHERPLSPRGRRAVKLIENHLRETAVAPALILCSTARRARQTLRGVAPAMGRHPDIRFERDLYGAGADELLERLQRVPAPVRSVMLIGHNPGLEDVALMLAQDGPLRDRLEGKFPAGALATLAIPHSSWRGLAARDGELIAYVVPKDLT